MDHAGVTFDTYNGQHIMFVNIDGVFKIQEENEQTLIFDRDEHIATLPTKIIKEIHWV